MTVAPARSSAAWASWAPWLPWALFAAMAVVSLVGVPAATAVARLFFLAVLVPGLIAGAGFLGRRAQTVIAAALLVLAVMQRTIDRPVAEPPSSQWTSELRGPEQVIRNTIVMP